MNNFVTYSRMCYFRKLSGHISWHQRRYRYKKKWAVNRPHRTPSQLALDHFDMFYQPVFGQKWPSIRIALLTSQKYCALVNNFAESETVLKLQQLGAVNMADLARKRAGNISKSSKKTKLKEKGSSLKDEMSGAQTDQFNEHSLENQNWHKNDNLANDGGSREHAENENKGKLDDEHFATNRKETERDLLSGDSDLFTFVPAETVYSEPELLQQEEIKQSTFTPNDVPIDVIPDKIVVPTNLQVFVYPKGEIKDFPTPQSDKAGLLGYYLMDAASILPVIALNLEPGDSVLDLCAAPGGKSLTILQTLLTEQILCNDQSYSRLQRLRDILKWYVPSAVQTDLQICRRNGTNYTDPSFSKVLVDVPCSTDRHVVTADDNNLFKPGRFSERLQLPNLQSKLLLAGIRSCKPEDSIVYSTCTLSPAQNDGVIQATMEHIWKETGVSLAVQDLSPLRLIFRDIFNFVDCRYGQLVIPSLMSNFGPMYICKIKKMN
ncbi:hypothetical protein ScPMuIL_012603 [Solemya velum]